MRSSRTSSGNAPESRTWSWKARRSNLSPSSFFALSRAPGFRAGRSCRRVPGRAMRCSDPPRPECRSHRSPSARGSSRPSAGGSSAWSARRYRRRAGCAPDVVLKPAVVGVGILVEANVFAQALGIEAPAFTECGIAAELPEVGNVLQFLRDRNLQMVAGKSLVISG